MRRIGLLALVGIVGWLPMGCGSKSSPSGPSSSSNFTYPFLYSFGQLGSGGNGTFETQPLGIAVGFGAIFVSDTDYSAIDKFDMNGNYLGQNVYGGGTELGGIAIDKYSHVYVADRDGSSVDEFDLNLNYIKSFYGGGDLETPNDVKVDSDLNLYVSDEGDEAVLKIDQSDNFVAATDVPMLNPIEVALMPDNSIFVADVGDHVVANFDSTLSYQGNYFDGSSGTQFDEPVGIAVDSKGSVIVTDNYTGLVQKFTKTGSFLGTIGNTSGSVTFQAPGFVAIDSNNRLYVTDLNAGNVDIFNAQ